MYHFSHNIWTYRLESEFGPNKQIREAYLQKMIRPRIEAAYAENIELPHIMKDYFQSI